MRAEVKQNFIVGKGQAVVRMAGVSILPINLVVVSMSEPLLAVKNLSVAFQHEGRFINVVDAVSFDLQRGQCIGIVGESGCGKSVTSLSLMQLIPHPVGKISGGEIFFQGKEISKLGMKELRQYRGREMVMIFQEPMTALNPVYTVGTQMLEVFHKELPQEQARARVIELLRRVGLAEPELLLKNYPYELSGGMRQRVMIAMAIANNPSLLIADEPTTALDVTIQAQIMQLMKEVQTSLGMAMILITHDLGVVFEMCDYVHVMYAGRIIESCTVKQLYDSPAHPYTRGLLDSLPNIDTETAQRQRLPTIPGNVPSIGNFPRGCRFSNRCARRTNQCDSSVPPLQELGDGHRVACFHPLSVQ